jgi:hypothetical protein
MYVKARFGVADWMSGLSNSTRARETPPSVSPTPDSTRERTSGATTRQLEHHEAVQRVRRGVRDEVDRERYV